MSRHWARIKEAGAPGGMRFMVLLYELFGRSVFRLVLYPVIAYFFVRRGEARRASLDYIRRLRKRHPAVLPGGCLGWLSFRHFLTFGDMLLDKYLAWVHTPELPLMEPAAERELLQLMAERQGLLILGSHFGNLEYARAISSRFADLAINVLIYDQHAGKFAALMADSEPQSRMNLLQVTDLDTAMALDLKQRVQRGEWVVIAGDRVPVSEQGRVSTAPFLGEDARFPIGPYVLAAVLECPVYLFCCYRKPAGYHMGLERFAGSIELPREQRQEVLAGHVAHYAEALERQVLRAPLQWFNFFDFWRQ